MAGRLEDHQLLWVDLDGRSPEDLAARGRGDRHGGRAGRPPRRAVETGGPDPIRRRPSTWSCSRSTAEADGDTEADPVARPIDIVGGRNWVVTVHDGPLEALVRLDAEREGETRLGALDAGTFVAAVVDEVLADYFEAGRGHRARDRPAG